MLTNSELKMLVDFLLEKLSPAVIYLFGSEAADQTHQSSDIDLAFLSETSISDYERFMLAQELATITKRDVDLIDLNKTTTVFQIQVISTGKVLYCDNETKLAEFEVLVMKKYARLNEERQAIIDDIIERGNVYGQ
ncbi:nucleotidyltransferase domain-containing protein [Bacillus tianshenii]|nr:nucleotidyltransferase domain-containing protein [Bacillus tianshenii]